MGDTISVRVRLFLSFLLAGLLLLTGVPSFAETPATAAGGIQSQQKAPPKPGATAPERQRRPQPLDEVSTIFEQKGVLTPKYSVTFEPSLQYSHSSTNRIALTGYVIVPAVVVGLIDVRDVDDDTFIAAIAARIGITNRLELELKVPYVYRNNSAASAPLATPTPPSVFSTTGHGFGDEEATIRYQINQPAGPGAIFIASLRGKLRTGMDPFEVTYADNVSTPSGEKIPTELPVGSGFYTVQPGITMIFPADPAVIFGSLNYQWNVKRTISGVGTVDPGNSIGINFGMGIGLNENLSFSLGYDHTVVGTNKLDGARLGNSKTTQVGSMLFGANYRLGPRTTMNMSLGIGATPTAPDVQFTVKVPTNFF
ncbi:MAG TPA: transporter [Candidatus Methylomirabilis sp.]|nr:transporter [Candidatus Methylomirabilis sp.]